MSSDVTGVRIPGQVVDAILTHAAICHPEECCGLIASDDVGNIRFAYPLTNVDRSLSSFTIAPEESYGAFMHADGRGWTISGDFHSHPNGPDTLSATDIERNASPSWLHLLVGPAGIKTFRIEGGIPSELAPLH